MYQILPTFKPEISKILETRWFSKYLPPKQILYFLRSEKKADFRKSLFAQKQPNLGPNSKLQLLKIFLSTINDALSYFS